MSFADASKRQVGLAEWMSHSIERVMQGVHTCMPARVDIYDVTTQSVWVTPMVRPVHRVVDGVESATLPQIPNVPVAYPRWGGASVSAPLAAGDFVLLVFAEAGYENWRQTGQVSDADALGRFRLVDAIAIPCALYPAAQSETGPAGLRMGYATKAVHVTSSEVALGSASAPSHVATGEQTAAYLLSLAPFFTQLATSLAAAGPALATLVGPAALVMDAAALGTGTALVTTATGGFTGAAAAATSIAGALSAVTQVVLASQTVRTDP